MENQTSVHHFVGLGERRGCAHSDSELARYINAGVIPNPDCPAINRANQRDKDFDTLARDFAPELEGT